MEAVQQPNQQYSETSRNIFLSKCIEVTKQALDADACNNLQQALALYTKSIEMLMELMKSAV